MTCKAAHAHDASTEVSKKSHSKATQMTTSSRQSQQTRFTATSMLKTGSSHAHTHTHSTGTVTSPLEPPAMNLDRLQKEQCLAEYSSHRCFLYTRKRKNNPPTHGKNGKSIIFFLLKIKIMVSRMKCLSFLVRQSYLALVLLET